MKLLEFVGSFVSFFPRSFLELLKFLKFKGKFINLSLLLSSYGSSEVFPVYDYCLFKFYFKLIT